MFGVASSFGNVLVKNIRSPLMAMVRTRGMAGKPIVAAKMPYCETINAGTRYSWCSCGLSKKQPFCDGSHRGSGMKPHRLRPEETTEVYFCGCKQTKTPPYCDGSHMADNVQACKLGETL